MSLSFLHTALSKIVLYSKSLDCSVLSYREIQNILTEGCKQIKFVSVSTSHWLQENLITSGLACYRAVSFPLLLAWKSHFLHKYLTLPSLIWYMYVKIMFRLWYMITLVARISDTIVISFFMDLKSCPWWYLKVALLTSIVAAIIH